MLKEKVFGMVLMLLLTSIVTLAFTIQPVKAQPTTIYVDDDNVAGPWDGTPEHPYLNITSGLKHALEGGIIFVYNGTYYENVVVNKTTSLVGESREATIIDGKGTGDVVTIISNGSSLSNFTIQASGFFGSALRLENASGTTIVNNTLTNSFYSLVLAFSDFNIIMDNDIAPGSYYSHFYNSSHNILTRNTIGGLRFGWGSFNNTLAENAIGAFWLGFSSNTKLRDNNFSYFLVDGDMHLHFSHDIDSSNMLNEKPIYYWVYRENAEVPSDAGYVALIDCINITIRGSNFENNFQSIIMFSTNNSRILNNNITNINEGILIFSSSNNTISENTIANNSVGIQLINECSNNNIYGNNVTANGLGIWLERSSSNRIFHNNFVGNVNQVNSYKSTNTWDDDYPSGGNYWSNYTGVDIRCGFNQDETGSDGIGDTAHEIDADNRDRYPLMGPFSTFDAGTWNALAYNVDIVSNSTVSNFQIDTFQKTISFNVSGVEETGGFCRVNIPNIIVEDLWQGNYTVLLNGEPWSFRNWTNTENTCIYINYAHSEHQIIIIPEFPSSIILPLLMALTMLAVVFAKKKLLRKHKPKLSDPFF